MSIKIKKSPIIIWLVVWLLLSNLSGVVEAISGSGSTVTQDESMTTNAYHTEITVKEDQSYEVAEKIDVTFYSARHGIYRYIPNVGTAVSVGEDEKTERIPYRASVVLGKSDQPVSESTENGNKVYRFGDENRTVSGNQTYSFTYQVTPQFQAKEYNNAYYNVFPTQWQNAIPSGSSFSITFPKDFDQSKLKLYYGTFGETKNAKNILTLTWKENTLTGVLNRDLQFGEGITFFVPMKAGYFTQTHQIKGIEWLILIPVAAVFLILLILFLVFGKDETIISSIQYQPPEGLDSASVGYIIDGSVENKDLISLIIYWADKGYIGIKEQSSDNLVLVKKQDLPTNAPSYQHTLFNRIFENTEKRDLSTLKYKFEGTLEMAGKQLKNFFRNGTQDAIYTTSSKVARAVALVLCTLPLAYFMAVTSLLSYTSVFRIVLQVILWIALLAGVIIFCRAIDQWYTTSGKMRRAKAATALGICFISAALYTGSYIVRVLQGEVFQYIWVLAVVLILTACMVILTGFMKKRTARCIEWMGRLTGLRDFIETAELDRMNELANGNPEWFYHIIPYTYAFGL